MSIIKTPDQRVRVFISSTINELADERKAAREAIGNLRLIPVFFEAGARPHPPRDLYSAYLDQSHIFLGIYWNSYGWVAPGAKISGLEDEYRLCGNDKPKLIYVKRSSERQSRLQELLADIEKSETACYQTFSDADELQRLIENDLSVLLSESFENALSARQPKGGSDGDWSLAPHHRFEEIPNLRSEIYGREEDLARVNELLIKPGVGLLTLLGAGGTGKTTLSVHVAHAVKDRFRNGAIFVPLAPVTDHRLVGATLAGVMGIQDSGKQPIEQTLVDFLSDKQILMVLDNFEQVVEASRFLSDILGQCKDVKILVTSRTSLHIRNERIYNLAPLVLPGEHQILSPEELRKYPATLLFVERALEVNQGLRLNKENTEAILEICRRLDGLPLAIELAAARTKFFQPAAMMARIEKSLDLVSKGQKDLPERQQTLRAAIEWSYGLLAEDTRKAFRQLGIFKRSWTLDAMDVVLNGEKPTVDVEEMTERLLDVSLIKPSMAGHASEPRFNMLQTVHEYAMEMLEQAPEALETKKRYADYFLDLSKAASEYAWWAHGESWLDKLETEYQNIRSAFYFFIEQKEYEKAWDLFYYMVVYWNIRGGFSEGLKWIEDAGILNPELQESELISVESRGRTLTWAALVRLMLMQIDEGYQLLHKAEEMLAPTDNRRDYAYALLFDGCFGAFLGFPDAPVKIEQARVLCEGLKEPLPLTMFYVWGYEYYRQQNRMDLVNKHFEQAQKIASELGITYILGALFIQKFSLDVMNPENDWEQTAREAQSMYKLLPEKGYKGLKSAAMNAYAYAQLMQGKPEASHLPLMKALEFARECGEKESEFYGIMLAIGYFKVVQNNEKAYKLFGALDTFLEVTQYPLIGASEVQYAQVKSKLEPNFTLAENNRWYDEGRKWRIEEAVMYAMQEQT